MNKLLLPKHPIDQISEAISLMAIILMLTFLSVHYSDIVTVLEKKQNTQTLPQIWLYTVLALTTYGLLTYLILHPPKKMQYPVKITPRNASIQQELLLRLLRVLKATILISTIGALVMLIRSAFDQESPAIINIIVGIQFFQIVAFIIYYIIAKKRES